MHHYTHETGYRAEQVKSERTEEKRGRTLSVDALRRKFNRWPPEEPATTKRTTKVEEPEFMPRPRIVRRKVLAMAD